MSSRAVVRSAPGRKRGPGARRTTGGPQDRSLGLRATPELAQAVQRWLDTAECAGEPTLADARAALVHAQPYWSAEGELLYPQDRTALMIELDELIDRCGPGARARDLVEGNRG